MQMQSSQAYTQEAAARRNKKKENNKKKKKVASKDEADQVAPQSEDADEAAGSVVEEEEHEGERAPAVATVTKTPILPTSPITVKRAPARGDTTNGRLVTVVAVRKTGLVGGAGPKDVGRHGKVGEWEHTTKHQPHAAGKDAARRGPCVVVAVKQKPRVPPEAAQAAAPRSTSSRGKATPLPVKAAVNGHSPDASKLSAAFKQQATLRGGASLVLHSRGPAAASPGSNKACPQPSVSQSSPVPRDPSPAPRAWKQPQATSSGTHPPSLAVPSAPASTLQQWPPLPPTASPGDPARVAHVRVAPQSPTTTGDPAAAPQAGMAGMTVQADTLWALPLLPDSNATPPAIPVPAPPSQPVVETVFTPFFSPSTSIWSAGNGSLGSGMLPGAASPQTPAASAAMHPQGDDTVPDSVKNTARLYGMCCPLTQV